MLATNGLIQGEMVYLFTEMFAGQRDGAGSYSGGVCAEAAGGGEVRKRRTARVMLLDEGGAVLLIRFVAMRPDGEFVFWALPGGEIEDGETEAEAAARELNEELGLSVAVEGPVYRDVNQFWHQGEMQDNQDFLFRGRCGRDEPRLAGVTRGGDRDDAGDAVVDRGGD